MNTPPNPACEKIGSLASATSPDALATNEGFWAMVRAEFARPEDFVHLEYGYYHPACHAVIATEIATITEAQRRGSHYKRHEMNADREAARTDLARVAGASPEEVILTRNTTEAFNIILRGLPLARGDEIVHSDLDYGGVVEALEQRAQRDGVVLRPVTLPPEPSTDAEIIARFTAAITPRTRAILITHVINHTGQVLPVKALCALGRSRGLEVIVDAAHSFAQFAFTVGELDCDYLGASLHKWLAAPLGTGLLYVRRSRIATLEPLFSDTGQPVDNIRKLEHFGNRPDSAHRGLREAIRLHEAIGAPAKQARLRFLQHRWTSIARTLPGVRVLTSADPSRHGAIGTFAIEGMEPKAIVDRLMSEHGIFVNAVDHPRAPCVRVTPGLATSLEDIDRLLAALRSITAAVANSP